MKNKTLTLILSLLSFALLAGTDKNPCNYVVTISKTNVLCHGEATGAATVNIQGPTGPYEVEWSTGATTNTISSVEANTYFVEIIDQQGCKVVDLVSIKEPAELSISGQVADVLCNGEATGEIAITVSGGNPSSGGVYSYEWSDGSSAKDAVGLLAGAYSLTVRDANLCNASTSFTISEPDILNSESIVTAVSCFEGSDGEIETFTFGGVFPYSYAWSNGALTKDVNGLLANTYTRTITDANGCELIEDVLVPQPEPITTTMDITDVKCSSGEDGAIDLTVFGGTAPYSFVWSNSQVILGEDTEDLEDLEVDQYKVRVTDALGCTHLDSGDVIQPQVLITSIIGHNVTCYEGNDGAADFSVSGGTLPYEFKWSNGEDTEDISELTADEYNVLVTDSNGCTGFAEVNITQPNELIGDFFVTTVTCRDQQDGTIGVVVSGGTPPYTYTWSTGALDVTNLTDLDDGIYTLEIEDDSLCTKTTSVTVPVNDVACLFIPNAFSPNSDGINDTWVITNAEVYPELDIKVVNRWGRTIYTFFGTYSPWDGTYNGKIAPSDTYYYSINTNAGDPIFTGELTILK